MYTKKVTIVVVVFALFVLISAAPVINAQKPLTVNAAIKVANIVVDATMNAVDTGIQVREGDIIKVTAEGAFKLFPTDKNWTYEGDTTKPAAGPGAFAFPNAKRNALAVWTGTVSDINNYSQVKNGDSVKAAKDGSIFFAVNDHRTGYGDNSGGLVVTVELTRLYNIHAETNKHNEAWGKGLVQINKGDELKIEAVGKVKYYNEGSSIDIAGKGTAGNNALLLAPKVKPESLIGKVGDSGEPFLVGISYPKKKVNENGWLFLSVNDQLKKDDAFTNNSGDIYLVVEVMRSPKPFKKPI